MFMLIEMLIELLIVIVRWALADCDGKMYAVSGFLFLGGLLFSIVMSLLLIVGLGSLVFWLIKKYYLE